MFLFVHLNDCTAEMIDSVSLNIPGLFLQLHFSRQRLLVTLTSLKKIILHCGPKLAVKEAKLIDLAHGLFLLNFFQNVNGYYCYSLHNLLGFQKKDNSSAGLLLKSYTNAV